ncbi:MAG: hypothetical protein ACI30I_08320, partial [Parabacteroides sp.]
TVSANEDEKCLVKSGKDNICPFKSFERTFRSAECPFKTVERSFKTFERTFQPVLFTFVTAFRLFFHLNSVKRQSTP